SVEHMQRYTTQGMATDQGKNSNVAALAGLGGPPRGPFCGALPPLRLLGGGETFKLEKRGRPFPVNYKKKKPPP
ncbi:hypothetical protein, partial [Tritonibacter mobilis]|uniref:hypothetical protein n=1 Tax=Tritonibacter mobilis TaxID=379347 RepID=UPI000A3EB1A3